MKENRLLGAGLGVALQLGMLPGARATRAAAQSTAPGGLASKTVHGKLEASGIVNRSVPQTFYNYHGYFAYNFGDTEGPALRPGWTGRDAVRQPRHRRGSPAGSSSGSEA